MTRKMWSTFLALAVGLTMALISGCAPPTLTSTAPVKTTPHYIIGPGDTLSIYVRDNPKLSVTIPVRPDGRISMPLVQDVRAAGRTPSQLADVLTADLSQYIRSPNVTVMVTSFVGAYRDEVRVVGQAVKPEAVAYRDGMTLLDVMIQVGGLTKFAAGNRAEIVRRVNGKDKTFTVHVEALLNGNIKDNVTMRPGDILIIPEAYF